MATSIRLSSSASPSTVSSLVFQLYIAPFSTPTFSTLLVFPKASVPQPPGASIARVHPRPATCAFTRCRLESNQTDAGLGESFLGEMGFREEEDRLLLGQTPGLNLGTSESGRTRVSSLQSALGPGDFGLSKLLKKYRYLLTSEEVGSFLQFVLDVLPGKIEPARIKRLLVTVEPELLVGFDRKADLLVRHGVPKEKIAHVLSGVNFAKALCSRSIEEIDRMAAFLKRYGGIGMVISRPMILNFDLDTQLIPKAEFFKDLSDGNEDAVRAIFRRKPAILCYSLEHLESQVEALRSYAGLSSVQISRIFQIYPSGPCASKERKLHPRIHFLRQCGLDSDEIFKFLTKAPLFLGLSWEDNLVHKLAFLTKIGFIYGTKELATALGAVTRTSCENLQKVVGLFFSYGLSPEDIFCMSRRHPQVLQYSSHSVEKKLEYLTEGIGRDVGEILAFPAFLGYKLERIKWRYEVKKKTTGEGLSLNRLLAVSALKFRTQGEESNQLVDSVNKE